MLNTLSMKSSWSLLGGFCLVLFFAGCAGHQPLPRLDYRPANATGAVPVHEKTPPVVTGMALEAGQSIGHSLTSYALLPGGYAMPISSGPSATGDFNADDQAAFVENLARVLTERGVIKLAEANSEPTATITVKFLKTEHFPEMQDYVLDALVTARAGDKSYEKVHHVSTIDGVNLVARMFQHGIDGRKNAAELLLASVVPELEQWFSAGKTNTVATAPEVIVPLPFDPGALEIAQFLRARYARPSTFWKDGISVRAARPSENVAVIELRWSNSDALPPFCVVDLYAAGQATRAVIRERDSFLSARAHVKEALQEFVQQIPATVQK